MCSSGCYRRTLSPSSTGELASSSTCRTCSLLRGWLSAPRLTSALAVVEPLAELLLADVASGIEPSEVLSVPVHGDVFCLVVCCEELFRIHPPCGDGDPNVLTRTRLLK